MNINLHIERLVLDGVNIAPDQRHLLQASVETELTRLLTDGGLSPSLAQGTALPRISAERHPIDGRRQPDATRPANRTIGVSRESVMNKTTVAQQAKTASFLPPAQGILQRKCACGNHTVAGGECAECAKNKSGLQRKLAIGASNDPLEQEADRVADQALAAPAHSAVSGAHHVSSAYAGQATGQMDTAPASVDRVLASSGRPLEPALRQDMEQRFGHDFSRVRVHSGAAAEQSARDVNARAFTVGRNVVFGRGEYRHAPPGGITPRARAHTCRPTKQEPGVLHPAYALDFYSDTDPLHDPSRLTNQEIEPTDEYAEYMAMQAPPEPDSERPGGLFLRRRDWRVVLYFATCETE